MSTEELLAKALRLPRRERARVAEVAMQRFPYLIAFERHEHHFLVLAIAHAKRQPL
jgi:hypothetical protein